MYRSTILDLGTPLPLYPRRKSSRYPLDTRLDGPSVDLDAAVLIIILKKMSKSEVEA
jgi:hypothetical protein